MAVKKYPARQCLRIGKAELSAIVLLPQNTRPEQNPIAIN